MTSLYGGMMSGSMIAASIVENQGTSAGWLGVACCSCVSFLVIVLFTTRLVDEKLAALGQSDASIGPNKDHFWTNLDKEQLRILRESNGLQPEVFMMQLSDVLKDVLEHRNYYVSFSWAGDM